MSLQTPNTVDNRSEEERMRTYEEDSQMAAFYARQGLLTLHVRCDKHPAGTGANAAMACKHCTQQDEIKPNGIIRTPSLIFLCRDCYNLHERKKLNLGNDLVMQCKYCIFAEVLRIQQRNPGLFADLSEDPLAVISRFV